MNEPTTPEPSPPTPIEEVRALLAHPALAPQRAAIDRAWQYAMAVIRDGHPMPPTARQ